MVEANPRITARRFTAGLPRLLGIPLHLGTDLVAIHGTRRVEGVTLRRADGTESTLETDGVIVTGGFTPEATLVRLGSLALDRSEEHTSELQSLMRISYAVFCSK